MVHANDSGGIVSIAQLRPISVVFTLPQERLPDVTRAMRAERLTTLAFTQDGKQLLASGSLELVDNAVDQATGTIRLKSSFPNDDEALWPGQFVSIRLRLTTRTDATVIAGPAVQRNQDGTYAWVVKADNTVEVRPIRVEAVQEDQAVIGGLAVGERVVIAGHSRLRPGAKIVDNSARPAVAETQAPKGQTR